jgi:ribose transport system substrate-binding protein
MATHRSLRLVAALVGLLAVLVFAACGDDDSSSEESKSGNGGSASAPDDGSGGELPTDFTLGYSTGFLDNPALAIQLDATKSLAGDVGIEFLTRNANGDAGQQITDVRNLIDAGAKSLITIVADSKAIIPALDYAEQREVPVVSVDIGPDGGSFYVLVKADNVRMAREACMEMGKRLEGEGKVLNLLGDLATINGRDRTDGFNDCMKSEFPDIEVINKPTNWRPEDATNQTQTVVNSVSDLAGIYMQSDAVDLSGVLNVLKAAGKDAKVGEPGHIVLISIDGTPLAIDKIRSGELDAAVSQPIDLYSKYGVEYAQKAVAGVKLEPGPTDHDSNIVELDNGNLADELPAPVVTKENADDSSLWGNQAK